MPAARRRSVRGQALPAAREQAIRMVLAGQSMRRAGEAVGVASPRVRQWLLDEGLPIRARGPSRFTPAQRAAVVAAYSAGGRTLRELADEIGADKSTISKWITKASKR